jgi:hypothetical protein
MYKALAWSYLAVALFATMLFGTAGLRFVLAMGVLMLPIFLILRELSFEIDESLVFSFFLGLGVVSTITYYSGLLLGSLFGGVMTSAVLLWGSVLLLGWRTKKKRS